MKTLSAIIVLLSLSILANCQKIKTQIDTVSYCISINIANNLKNRGIENLNPKLIVKAFEDIYSGNELDFDLNTADSIINDYFIQLNEKEKVMNKEKGQKFLEENKKNEGVVELPSGLQYKIITTGTGEKPTVNDIVTCHYKGTLIDGTVFDSSYDRGEPIDFPVNGVIEGWTEALQLMTTGSKWILYIPSELAYGENGAGGIIKPNEALIFEVELLSINIY